MKPIRQAVIWGTPTAVVLLTVLSVVGAFLGDQQARQLFSSPPLIVFWFLLTGLLVAGFAGFRTLLRRPGLLAMHLGSLLILGGSMWASDEGHAFAREWLGFDKIPSSVMLIHQGETTDNLADSETDQSIGKLPFALKLNKFWIEYYAQGDRPWSLEVGTRRHPQGMGRQTLAWTPGAELTLPDTGIRVTVLQYLPIAKPVMDADGNVVGAEAAVGEGRPAMQVRMRTEGKDRDAWLVPEKEQDVVELPLSVPRQTAEAMRTGTFVMAQSLLLGRPTPPVLAYKSDLSVLKNGEEVVRKTIVVNDPLHFGGYHFYQASYDERANQYTVLLVKSDNGLTAVYAGFVLAVAGGFWWFWVVPVWQGLSGRSGHGA